MVNVFVQQEKNGPKRDISDQNNQISNLLLSFDDILKDLSYFLDHWYEESVVCLVH